MAGLNLEFGDPLELDIELGLASLGVTIVGRHTIHGSIKCVIKSLVEFTFRRRDLNRTGMERRWYEVSSYRQLSFLEFGARVPCGHALQTEQIASAFGIYGEVTCDLIRQCIVIS